MQSHPARCSHSLSRRLRLDRLPDLLTDPVAGLADVLAVALIAELQAADREAAEREAELAVQVAQARSEAAAAVSAAKSAEVTVLAVGLGAVAMGGAGALSGSGSGPGSVMARSLTSGGT